MKARFGSVCPACGGNILKGSQIRKDSGEWVHAGCASTGNARADREYRQGAAEAARYLSDKAIYGEELADQWELERELRGLDW